MRKLVSDRRLWLTADGDQVVEDGDPLARFLLVACAGRMIPAAVAERLELKIVDGRLVYPGAPGDVESDGGAEETDEGEDPTTHKFGGDKSGGRDKVDPPPGAKPELEDETEKELEDGDDSDRNSEPPLEWPGRTSPEAYLKRYPTGPKAELAAAVIAQRGAGGAS